MISDFKPAAWAVMIIEPAPELPLYDQVKLAVLEPAAIEIEVIVLLCKSRNLPLPLLSDKLTGWFLLL